MITRFDNARAASFGFNYPGQTVEFRGKQRGSAVFPRKVNGRKMRIERTGIDARPVHQGWRAFAIWGCGFAVCAPGPIHHSFLTMPIIKASTCLSQSVALGGMMGDRARIRRPATRRIT
jgi:hypothetical protein